MDRVKNRCGVLNTNYIVPLNKRSQAVIPRVICYTKAVYLCRHTSRGLLNRAAYKISKARSTTFIATNNNYKLDYTNYLIILI